MAGILKVDTLQSDSNLALKIATANVAFIDSTGLNVVGGNLTIGATQFAEGGQVQTAGIADGAVTNDKIASVNASVISSGTLGIARLPAGSVLQVVQGTYSTGTAITSTSLSDTGLSASITPTSASSKILVITSQTVRMYRANNTVIFGYIRLLRDSTGLLSGESVYEQQNLSGYIAFQHSFVVLDSPSTTSSVTYKTQGRLSSTADSSQISFQPDSAPSTITLVEIAG